MLVEIRVPLRAGSGSAYEKVDRRAGDWAVVAAGAAVELAGRHDRAGGHRARRRRRRHHLRARPRRRSRAQTPSDELFARAAALAAASCRPVSDQRGSAEYKRHVAGVLTERVLRRATARWARRGCEIRTDAPLEEDRRRGHFEGCRRCDMTVLARPRAGPWGSCSASWSCSWRRRS